MGSVRKQFFDFYQSEMWLIHSSDDLNRFFRVSAKILNVVLKLQVGVFSEEISITSLLSSSGN